MANGTLKPFVQKRFEAALPPGERLEMALIGNVKPPAWLLPLALVALFAGVIPGLILLVVYNRKDKHYLFGLTDRSLHVRMFLKPTRVVADFPLGSVPISRIVPGKITTKVYMTLPGHPDPAQVVFTKPTEEVLDRLTAVSTLATATAGETA